MSVTAAESVTQSSVRAVSRGKAVCLISGGIDSPVALWLTINAGMVPIALFFDSYPLADRRGREIALLSIRKVRDYSRARPIRTYVIGHSPDLSEIVTSCQRNLACVISRRMMFRVAAEIARRDKADCLVTGDVVGQKASQTLHNLFVTDAAADGLPIIRPLVGMNKDEIEQLARAIGTYELSTSPGVAPCGIPTRKPRTHSRSEEIAQSERRLDLDHMISRALESAETADI
jgi:thiamine biosynthesis protein ThiI